MGQCFSIPVAIMAAIYSSAVMLGWVWIVLLIWTPPWVPVVGIAVVGGFISCLALWPDRIYVPSRSNPQHT